jgi:hypothetical protein
MEKGSIEEVTVSTDEHAAGEKQPSTAYTGDHVTTHVRSPLERRLFWKSCFLIVPCLSLIYFVAFLVREPCSTTP